MFAVIKTGGRQYRVVPDDVLEIGKIDGDVGTIVQLGEILMLGGDTPVLGLPTVAGAFFLAAFGASSSPSSGVATTTGFSRFGRGPMVGLLSLVRISVMRSTVISSR